MKGDQKKKSGYGSSLARMLWCILAVCSLLISSPPSANAAAISGESNTIFRMGKTTDDKKLYPLYEYLRFTGENNVGDSGSYSFNIGGWGRVDLADKSTDNNTDGDLQYGYLSYRANKNNLLLNAGRQFVAEGVATERIDGLYVRSDLAAGFGAAAFVGSPVVITQADFKGGDIIYGGRIVQGMPQYYSIGLSALRTDYSGNRLREEEGLDLWLHPFKQVDVVGRSSYNSITSGWMEHAYNVTYSPLESLRISANVSHINYKDYFYQVTTTALSLTNGLLDPNEKVTTLGGSVEFSPVKSLTLTVDYKNYDYDIAGQAKYYGGKATFSLAESFIAGAAVHRMDGENSRLRFDEYRVFASKNLGKADLTVDFFAVNYDSAINGITNTYSASGALSYAITDNLKLAADINYMKSSDFDKEVTGLVKVTYTFDKKFGSEGGAKSEKK